jgi:hypothetical protein
MEKIKNLVIVIAVVFGISFMDGVFSWGLSSGFYTLLGLIELVAIIWLLKLVFKKNAINQ